MDYRNVIADSWKYTQANKRLIYWFGFFPSIITTSVGVGYMAYQFFAFKSSYLFDDSETSFLHEVVNFGWNFISSHATLTVPLIIVACIVFVLWFLVPTLAEASAVQALARAKNGQKSGVGVGLKYGIMAFLPLIELHAFIKIFGPFTMINEMGFVLRNLGTELFKILLIPFIVGLTLGLFLKLLFTYADLYIIIDGEGVVSSMKKSAKLVLLSWQQTLLITILMLLIGARIIIQALLIFLIPGLLVMLGGYVASLTLNVAILFTFGAVGVVALLLVAYLGGVVDIFSYAVWTFTFLELTSIQEVSARDAAVSARENVALEPGVQTIETAPEAKIDTSESDTDEKIPGLL